jgi:hypothetical protein
MLVSCLTLNIKAAYYSETSVYFQHTIRIGVPEETMLGYYLLLYFRNSLWLQNAAPHQIQTEDAAPHCDEDVQFHTEANTFP